MKQLFWSRSAYSWKNYLSWFTSPILPLMRKEFCRKRTPKYLSSNCRLWSMPKDTKLICLLDMAIISSTCLHQEWGNAKGKFFLCHNRKEMYALNKNSQTMFVGKHTIPLALTSPSYWQIKTIVKNIQKQHKVSVQMYSTSLSLFCKI